MEQLDQFAAISLLLQAEGDYHWAIHHADLALPDPPVYGYGWDDESDDEETFVPDERDPVADRVTAFALDYVMAYAHGSGGGFGVEVADSEPLIHALTAAFPVRCRIGERQLFETDGILARLDPAPDEPVMRLSVEVAGPLPREGIPAFLWDHVHGGGSFHGMFITERKR
jgi:hypothetical protein